MDVVIETPDEVIPIEIKWTDSAKHKDIRHIEKFSVLNLILPDRIFFKLLHFIP